MPSSFRALGQPRIELQRTTSTMDEVGRHEAEGPEGLTVVAQEQTAGRGRGDHRWTDIPGQSLLFSTLLRPACPLERFQVFPVAAGLAVAEALQNEYLLRTQLKWPNDIMVSDRKLGGVLVTSRVTGQRIDTAIIGVGLNLLSTPADVSDRGVALADVVSRPINASSLLDAILARLGALYADVLSGQSEQIVRQWNDRAIWKDRLVTAQQHHGPVVGKLRGIDQAGRLMLEEVATGRTIRLVTGQVTRGVRPVDEVTGI